MSAPLDATPLFAPPGLAVRAALAMRRALQRAADLVVPPQLVLVERITATAGSVVIAELARLRVPDLLEIRALTAAEIAQRTSTDADAMARTLRFAVTLGLFARDADGRFTNNRLSSALTTSDRYSAVWLAEYFGSPSNQQAWSDFRETLRTGGGAFERVHGQDVWSWFDAHPGERETFARCMTTMTLVEAPGIAQTYPFGEIGTLCDVGGGRGTLLSELLVQHPTLRAVLCDAEGVLESARELLAQRGVLERVTLVPGSFFTHIPAGADAYLMKNVLHDWDDARCLAILERCRAVMRPGQKLLVVEALVEETADDFGPLADLHMMIVCSGGRERGRADYERLFEASGFVLARAMPTPTPMTVLECLAR
jgi:O-methyltransferase domain